MKQKIDDIVEKIEEIMEWGGTAKDITLLVISALALLISIFHLVPGLPFDAAWVAIILCGIPIIMEAVIGLVTAFDIKADVLVSLALIASVCIHEDFAAGEVAFIMQLGALLEGLTVARARAGIEKLVHLTPTTARRLVNGAEEVIAAEKVRVGDILKVLPGETVPVDGVILQGQTSINQAVIGNATKHGFLVREGDALERLAGVKRVTFDKTGTLTVGVPKVSMVKSLTQDYTDQELYALTAAAEKNSEHPLGKAIVNCFRKEAGGELMAVENFEMKPGQGVCAVASGKEVLAGNEKLMTAAGVMVDDRVKAQMEAELQKGCTVTLVAVNGKLAGLLALSDSLREESRSVICGLQRLGVTPVLLTGDNEYSAGQIAGQIGIRDVHANCLPEDKLNFIEEYQKQKELVCMIGDGVNDAPALKKAMIGIAMGGVGSDIAVDAADIALVDDEIKELPHLFALSGKMMNKIKFNFNLSFSMLLNFVAIILAMTGILNPVVGALVHNCGSVFVIINSAFLMSYTYRNI